MQANTIVTLGRRTLLGLMLGCAGAASLTGAAVAQDKQTLNLFIWGQYTDADLVKKFEEKYNARVVETNYNSLGEMFAKLQAGGDSQYDIVVPTNYYVPRLVHAGLLQPLDKAKLPNMQHLMDQFIDPPFDPGNQYVAPYQWGTTGIAYDKTKIANPPQSWAALFDPEANPNQPFSISTDPQVMLGGACAYLGKDYTCTDQKDLIAAGKELVKLKKRANFQGFMDGTPMLKALARGNIAMGVAYNGDLAFNKLEDPQGNANIEFFVPKEGGEIWLDSMGIPKNAPNAELAHQWIDFLLEPENGAQLSNYNNFGTPNKESVQYLDEAMRDPLVLPDAETLGRLHYTPSLSGKEQQFVQQLWDSIQSR